MAMDGKAEIRVGVKLATTKKQLQKQLNTISSGLMVESKAAKKSVKANKDKIQSIDKLISRYKLQEISYKQLQKYSTKLLESEKFLNKTAIQKAKVYDKLNKVDKDRTKVLAEKDKIDRKIIANNQKKIQSGKQEMTSQQRLDTMYLESAKKREAALNYEINTRRKLAKAIEESKKQQKPIKQETLQDKVAKEYVKADKQRAQVLREEMKIRRALSNAQQQQTATAQSASKKTVSARKQEVSSMDKLIARYKLGNITQEKFNEYSNRIINSTRFKNKSFIEQERIMRRMNSAQQGLNNGMFKFSTMLGQGIKKMLVWSNMVIMEFILNNKYNYAPYIE